MANTLVIVVATAVLHNFALMHREQNYDEDIEDEDVPSDIVAAADASGNAKRQLIISRYFDYIAYTFNDNKTGHKKEHSPQLIN